MTPEDAPPPSVRERVSAGMAWNAGTEVVQALVGLGVTLLLVRLVSPAEYGRLATATAILKAVSAFSIEPFAQHILLLPPGTTPDWGMHWRAGLRLNGGLALVALGVAVALLPTSYAETVPLVLAGAVGLVTGLPFSLAMVGYQRDLDFRRYRLWGASSQLLGHAVALTGALLGYGAMGIMLGTSALRYVPLAVHWLGRRLAGPFTTWGHAVPWTSYRASLRFGAQGITGTLLTQAQQSAEGLLVPRAFDFATLGLVGRASALFQQTAGRVAQVATDTIYPILPRAAHDAPAFRRQAAFVLQAALAFSAVAAAYFWAVGVGLSRLLYGAQWARADAFVVPCALYGAMLVVSSLAKLVPLAAGRLRLLVWLNALDAALAVAAVVWATSRGDVTAYPWWLLGAQSVSAGVAMATAVRVAGGAAWHDVVWPALVGGSAAVAAGAACRLLGASESGVAVLAAVVMPLVAFGAWRMLAPAWLAQALSVLPFGAAVRRRLRLA